MPDEVLTATGLDGISLTAATTTELVRETQARHALAPTATAAVGRLVTATAMLAASLKGSERVSLQISGDGPLGTVSTEAWLAGPDRIGVRGRVRDPDVDLPLNASGKFDVARSIGRGALQVSRSFESGPPYVGVVPLHSGEIAEDVAAYLAQSEQIPSVVALGVLANPEGVLAAGGIMAQVLPGTSERVLAALEERAKALRPVTTLMAEGATAHALLHELASGSQLRAHRRLDVHFDCLCTREKVERALMGLGSDELQVMAREGNESEASCEFCRKVYVFTGAELESLAKQLAK